MKNKLKINNEDLLRLINEAILITVWRVYQYWRKIHDYLLTFFSWNFNILYALMSFC